MEENTIDFWYLLIILLNIILLKNQNSNKFAWTGLDLTLIDDLGPGWFER